MRTIQFISYKISSGIDIKKVAASFRLSVPESWENSIILGEQQLTEVYKWKLRAKKIYIFGFGCITFENFTAEETSKFFEYLQSIIGDLDYKMLSRYNESLFIRVFKDQSVSLFNGSTGRFSNSEGLAGIIAVLLAKSAALSKLEADAELLLDEAEIFITKLQNNSLHTATRKFASTMAYILRFEFESIVSIRIYDRPSAASRHLTLRDAYDELAGYYELEGRYDVLQKKVDELRKITRSYSVLQFSNQESRLSLFEVFLLVLFPLSYLAHGMFLKSVIESILKAFVN